MTNLMRVDELRSILTATIRGVRSRHVKPSQAQAVYAGTSQLMNSYRLEIQYRKLLGQKIPENNGFLPAPTKARNRRKK